jgi:demethylmenaquinone methyltransferase/2-methoxy-6-polyprenyl-1,4-benzoquinol methylase
MAGHGSVGDALESVLAEQQRYYRDRAGEYEDWWFRRGRYDRGADANARWFAESAQLETELQTKIPDGARVLELACGTGLWTAQLARRARSLTAIDASPEMLAIARTKTCEAPVEFVRADIFDWQPERSYEACFFGFWLSHVPSELMPAFWEKVRAALVPGGRAYFVDSARSERSSARDHRLQQPGEELMLRRLDDGREYRIVKHWFDAAQLERLLERKGWLASVGATGEFFVHGSAAPAA